MALQWVPSHVWFPSNEKAYQKAKQVAKSPQLEVSLTLRGAKSILSACIDKCTALTQRTRSPGKPWAADEARQFSGNARIDGDHLLQCTGIYEYPTDDAIIRYWEARRQVVKHWR
ncbi:reverse transcriptase [Trichonephila clavipes]|nr:reverse transcriptase [Trichonephila clavipes]